jgi:hypothetical protein
VPEDLDLVLAFEFPAAVAVGVAQVGVAPVVGEISCRVGGERIFRDRMVVFEGVANKKNTPQSQGQGLNGSSRRCRVRRGLEEQGNETGKGGFYNNDPGEGKRKGHEKWRKPGGLPPWKWQGNTHRWI